MAVLFICNFIYLFPCSSWTRKIDIDIQWNYWVNVESPLSMMVIRIDWKTVTLTYNTRSSFGINEIEHIIHLSYSFHISKLIIPKAFHSPDTTSFSFYLSNTFLSSFVQSYPYDSLSHFATFFPLEVNNMRHGHQLILSDYNSFDASFFQTERL